MKQQMKYRPIKQLDKWTGEVIQKWPSAVEAGRALGTIPDNIARVARGMRPSAGGYRWSWDTKESEEHTSDCYCQRCGSETREVFKVCPSCF